MGDYVNLGEHTEFNNSVEIKELGDKQKKTQRRSPKQN